MPGRTALVTGGCGCVGYHVVKALLNNPSWSSIHVFSRSPNISLLPNVQYHAGDIRSEDDVRAVLGKVRPLVIFRVTSPISSGNNASEKLFYEVNVKGTKTLLASAIDLGGVKAFIYTSSASVVPGPYCRVDVSRSPITRTSGTDYYPYTKARAEELVLKANNSESLRTASLRISGVYGDRDNQMIPGILNVIHQGRQNKQIGDNKVLMSVCSVENAAIAHLLGAEVLIGHLPQGPLRVDGEAFFINGDKPVRFWDFSRQIWAAAGAEVKPESIQIVPAWFVISLAIMVEWLYYIFTFGQITPKFLRSHTIRSVTEERTFSVEKARKRLNYQPVDTMAEEIEKGVEWRLDTKGERRVISNPLNTYQLNDLIIVDRNLLIGALCCIVLTTFLQIPAKISILLQHNGLGCWSLQG